LNECNNQGRGYVVIGDRYRYINLEELPKRRKDMGKGLIFWAIILFIIGFLTPISNALTFPLSLLILGIGIARILQKKER
jgi:hypothetical protein